VLRQNLMIRPSTGVYGTLLSISIMNSWYITRHGIQNIIIIQYLANTVTYSSICLKRQVYNTKAHNTKKREGVSCIIVNTNNPTLLFTKIPHAFWQNCHFYNTILVSFLWKRSSGFAQHFNKYPWSYVYFQL